MKKLQYLVLITIFGISLFVPRFTKIERPITVDELTWLTFSSDFLYGLASGEYEHTYQDHHPGVTTMAAGTAAYVLEDKAYQSVGGYVYNETFILMDRLEEDGHSIFDVLVTARRLMALASSLALLLSLWFLWRLWGAIPAWITMMFVILDPMVIGQTRLYSHEGLMSCLLLLTWLSFYHYLKQGRKWTSLLVSGISMGLAALTKITSLGLVPVIGLAILVDIYQQRKSGSSNKQFKMADVFSALMPLFVWLLVLCVIFVAFWPATWAHPLQTVIRMFKHTMGFVSSGNSFSAQDNYEFVFFEGIAAYLHSIWAHPTLLTWFGNLIVLIALLFRKRLKTNAMFTSMTLFLYLYMAILITVVGGFGSFRADRYMTAAHVLIAFLGGAGIVIVIDWVKKINWVKQRSWFSWMIIAVIILAQVVIIYPARPYYSTYLNPLEGDIWWGVHGAFLDQAADYLAAKPGAESMTVMTFSPGSFMFFFPGETRMIIPDPVWSDREVNNITESDYLLINFELAHLNAPPRVIADIAEVEPEHTISFQGREYVWIYHVEDLPASVFVPDP